MDFSYFRRYFHGRDGRNIDPFDESEDIHENNRKGNSFDSFPFGSSDGEVHDLFQHMEDMFNRVFSTFFAPTAFPDFEEIPNETDPRAIMLKDPDNDAFQHPSHLEPTKDDEEEPITLSDSDIDDEVAKKGLFPSKIFEEQLPPRTFSYRQFSCVKTFQLPDGAKEEHRTFTDSSGKQVTKIRRCIFDQCHEIITHKDKRDMEEKEESYVNMNEADLIEFEKRWRSIKDKSENIHTHPSTSEPLLPLQPALSESIFSSPSGDPTYLNLFRKFFFK